jgi:hypothetical protein
VSYISPLRAIFPFYPRKGETNPFSADFSLIFLPHFYDKKIEKMEKMEVPPTAPPAPAPSFSA